jgi:hypothetical protein
VETRLLSAHPHCWPHFGFTSLLAETASFNNNMKRNLLNKTPAISLIAVLLL